MARLLHMTSNGLYGILLHDREHCTDSEIKSLISQFGKIRDYHRVLKSGSDLVFVHFQEYEEAKACLEQLERDPMFYAMPAIPREGRDPKPYIQREHSKSLNRVTNAESTKKSILRSRSTLAKQASQRGSSSDEHESAKKVGKDVRFVRPGSSSPTRRPKKSRYRGSDHLSGELQLSEESLYSEDRPPYLLNMMDLWTERCIEESGVLTSTEVIIYNLPLHATDGLVSNLCEQVVSVLSVEVHRFQFKEVPFIFAVVQLRSPDDARIVKKFLHRRSLKGKVIKAVFSSDFY